jgi:hypothetical protein
MSNFIWDYPLSIIEVNGLKIPKAQWKQYQSTCSPVENWHNHYQGNGYVGIITGRVSMNFETIDIDTKNDPENTIVNQYRALIPNELYDKLVVVETPTGGLHYRYRCPGVVIERNQELAKHSDGRVIIETRGEGGYVCHHRFNYKVLQGQFDLSNLKVTLNEITPDERELLLTSARSLNRFIKEKEKPTTYKDPCVVAFNKEYNGVELFTKHNWTIANETDERVYVLRPGSSAHHSGVYFKETKLFYCFSTSTQFKPEASYNNFQILQVMENIGDYRKAMKLLANLGYVAESTVSVKEKVTDQEIAAYLNNNGVRYNTFIQEPTLNGKVIEEMDNNTLYINLKEHFGKDISRASFENVIKSHMITKEDPILNFIDKYKDRNTQGAIEYWVSCLNLKNESIPIDIVNHFVKKWFVGLVAQCLDGEYPNEFFLAIISTRQGVGKTTLLRKYTLPTELHSYCKELSISDNDELKLSMCQSALIIDDEMDGRTLNEDKTFKAILSRMIITLRRKYDRRISNLTRRCSFAGCGNQVSVVRERQNRRIIPIEISSIDFKKLAKADQIDMFMEAYHLYKAGFVYSFESSDISKIQKLTGDYFHKTDLDEIIDDSIINPEDENDVYRISALELMNALDCKYPISGYKFTVYALGKVLADRGIESKRVGVNKTTCYYISKKSSIVQFLKGQNPPQNPF